MLKILSWNINGLGKEVNGVGLKMRPVTKKIEFLVHLENKIGKVNLEISKVIGVIASTNEVKKMSR